MLLHSAPHLPLKEKPHLISIWLQMTIKPLSLENFFSASVCPWPCSRRLNFLRTHIINFHTLGGLQRKQLSLRYGGQKSNIKVWEMVPLGGLLGSVLCASLRTSSRLQQSLTNFAGLQLQHSVFCCRSHMTFSCDFKSQILHQSLGLGLTLDQREHNLSFCKGSIFGD